MSVIKLYPGHGALGMEGSADVRVEIVICKNQNWQKFKHPIFIPEDLKSRFCVKENQTAAPSIRASSYLNCDVNESFGPSNHLTLTGTVVCEHGLSTFRTCTVK